MIPVIIWCTAASTVSFLLFGADKFRARRRQRRIPESVLLVTAALGGALGAMLGVQIFRHKTRKVKFLIGLPLCLLLNAAAVWLFIR